MKYTETAESPTTAPTDEPDTTDPRERIYLKTAKLYSVLAVEMWRVVFQLKGGQYSETANMVLLMAAD